ncbi:hypothetical protein C8R46DRAFT_1213998 [Mycena filopes]|nr:hypothetical protein C8R46DRAFT_1213998 [Mycena filopes]
MSQVLPDYVNYLSPAPALWTAVERCGLWSLLLVHRRRQQDSFPLFSDYQAHKYAGFSTRPKAHFNAATSIRISAGKSSAFTVDGTDTAKLGWKRGQTYFGTYAPALPKKAILGGAGFQATQLYEPIWQKLLVPPNFGNRALENMYGVLSAQEPTIRTLSKTIERRTTALSPSQGFSSSAYHRQAQRFLSPPPTSTAALQFVVHFDETWRRPAHMPGVENGLSPIRAFELIFNSSPAFSDPPRSTAQVDLVLSPIAAFFAPRSAAGIVAVWGPSKTINKFNDANEFWTTYVDREFVYTDAGMQTGKKPPMRLVE